MITPLPSLFWCVIQVSLVAGVALAVCWTLRGTRPQFATALLAGSAMASLLLGGLAFLPMTHWSIRDANTISWLAPISPFIDSSSKSGDGSDARDVSKPRTPNTPSESNSDALISTEKEAIGSPLPAMMLHWLLSKVQWIDEGVRNAERSSLVTKSTWFSCIPWILGLGVGLMTGLWLHAWLWMQWMVRNSERLSSDVLDERIRRVSEQMKLRRLPELRISDRVPIGATVGVLRPVLLLNRHWQRWTEHELEAVLLHEAAHMARYDFFWVVIGSWLRVLFFYHPLVHLLVRRWRLEQELAADQLAAGWMSSAGAYGRALASLALRAEYSVRTPSPVLSAEQICVIRRITMLKQGHMVPRRHGWRWAAAFTSLTVVLCVPLTGLRGTPPEDKPTDESLASSEATQATRDRLQRLKEINEKCPPLRLEGKMIWNPGRFQSTDFDHGMRYISQALTFAFLGSLPDDAAIHGRTHISLSWADLEKVHGNLSIGADVSEADQINPKVLSRFLTHPSLGGLRQSNQVKWIEGRQASALTRQVFDSETGSIKESDPVSWMVDDEQGFLQGSETEIAERLQGKSDPFAAIPAELLDQYRGAAFATVFSDCTTWMSDVKQHFDGSKERQQVALVYPLLDGLKHMGIFLIGSDDRDCMLRAVYSTVDHAKKSKAAIDRFVVLARIATASDMDVNAAKMLSELLDSLEVVQAEREVRIRCNPPISFYRSMVLSEFFQGSVPGWYSLLGTVGISKTEPQVVRFQGTREVCCPSFLTQTIAAEKLRGKRVRLTAELRCHPEERARTGLVLWASKHDGRSTAQASIGADGATNLATIATNDAYTPPVHAELETYPVSIELDVDNECDVLSLGIYAKQTEVLISKVRLEVNPIPLRSKPAVDPITSLNLLQVPFVPVHTEPRNLDFAEPARSDSEPAPGIAEQEQGTVKK